MNARAIRAIKSSCEHCDDKRQVWNETLGRNIRCPQCSRRRRMDPSGLQQVNQAERARREQQAITRNEPSKFTALDWTIAKLYEWGRWVRDNGIGYPPMSTTEKARIGRGGKPGDRSDALPGELEAIDRAVSTAPVEYKTLLIEHYTKFGYNSEKAVRLGISRQTYYQRKASAERYVATAIGV